MVLLMNLQTNLKKLDFKIYNNINKIMLSYSAITNRGKVSLPSVDNWGSNLNILKDPPKSIHTRNKTLVGSNNDIIDEVGDSGNRIGEYINVYARGVNPFVSVSYSNNNTGLNGNGSVSNQGQAKLPYRIMRDGAFRPPVLSQEDLLPLSRLPRVKTEAKTNIGNVDYTRKLFDQEQQEKSRQIKEEILHTFVKPTAVYKIEKPQEQTYDVKFSIKEVIKKGTVSAGFGAKNIVQTEVKVPTAEIIQNNLRADARTNVGDTRKFLNNNQMYTEKYIQDSNAHSVQTNMGSKQNYVSFDSENFDSERFIQDSNAHSVQTNMGTKQNYVSFDTENFDSDRYIQDTTTKTANTNPSTNKHYTLIDELADLSDLPVKNKAMVVSTQAPVSKQDKVNYIHADIELDRNVPEYSANASKSENIYKFIEATNQIELERNTPITSFVSNIVGKSSVDNNSKDARLNPKINAGSFSIPAGVPKITRSERENIDTAQSRMAKSYKNDANQRFNMQAVNRHSQNIDYRG